MIIRWILALESGGNADKKTLSLPEAQGGNFGWHTTRGGSGRQRRPALLGEQRAPQCSSLETCQGVGVGVAGLEHRQSAPEFLSSAPSPKKGLAPQSSCRPSSAARCFPSIFLSLPSSSLASAIHLHSLYSSVIVNTVKMVEGDVNQAKKSFMGMPVSSSAPCRVDPSAGQMLPSFEMVAPSSCLAFIVAEVALLTMIRASLSTS
jgi:hypothetical protein